ncbi:MAG: ABC transporter ATP-binding protein [Bacteroidetes bacterium]|nr:ABC transporter ATP-binding protein [Bacteroidota bacterium]
MLELNNISVSFPGFSLKNISLKVEKGDYFTVLGMSGAGKTLMLEIIAGLQRPDSGKILLNNQDITNKNIQGRRIGLVYQDLCLFPHLTVADNILYPLKNKKFSKQEKSKTLEKLAGHMEISHLLERYPKSLSGGEAQRVALARTLASNPEVLLLDEPLSNLDVKLKSELRQLLKKINLSGKTIIHVTHDYTEAATLSNKVALIENGVLIQTGCPDDVFRHPVNEFVARFRGYKNLFKCTFESGVNSQNHNIARINNEIAVLLNEKIDYHKGFIVVPEQDIILSEAMLETSALNRFKGVVKEFYQMGFGMEVIIETGVDFSVVISQESFQKMNIEKGKELWITFKASAVKTLNG